MSLPRIEEQEYARVFRWAREQGLIEEQDTVVFFYSLDQLDSRLHHLRDVFPANVLHAVAIKTNPLLGLLKYLGQQGFALEAASLEEVFLARAAGLSAGHTVFDSPVKTPAEIRTVEADFSGLILNANSLAELAHLSADSRLRWGLRINPLLQTGAPEVFDVSNQASKFGVPISHRAAIIQAFLDHPRLEGLHMHIGSQIERIEATAQAVALLYDLGRDIKAARQKAGLDLRLSYVDIGGGFPASYAGGPQTGMEALVGHIQNHCPNLFREYQVITEFGRFVHAHNGWVLSRVESVHHYQNTPIALVHAGADMFVREIYQTGSPRHQMSVLDQQGQVKRNSPLAQDIGGPLCFAGDFIERGKILPEIGPGDYLVVGDAGANSIGLWSRHCSRVSPKVIAYSLQRRDIHILKERESIEQIIQFWS